MCVLAYLQHGDESYLLKRLHPQAEFITVHMTQQGNGKYNNNNNSNALRHVGI